MSDIRGELGNIVEVSDMARGVFGCQGKCQWRSLRGIHVLPLSVGLPGILLRVPCRKCYTGSRLVGVSSKSTRLVASLVQLAAAKRLVRGIRHNACRGKWFRVSEEGCGGQGVLDGGKGSCCGFGPVELALLPRCMGQQAVERF